MGILKDLFKTMLKTKKTTTVIEEQLVIGFVECNECGIQWEALTYNSCVERLQCPKCCKQNSKVIGATSNGR